MIENILSDSETLARPALTYKPSDTPRLYSHSDWIPFSELLGNRPRAFGHICTNNDILKG